MGSVANRAVWEFIEVQVAGLSTESPPTLQISVASATATQSPTALGQPGIQGATVAQAQTQESTSPCSVFQRNRNGSWTCRTFVAFDTSQYWIEVSKWTAFVLGNKFLVFDLEKRLDENCI